MYLAFLEIVFVFLSELQIAFTKQTDFPNLNRNSDKINVENETHTKQAKKDPLHNDMWV